MAQKKEKIKLYRIYAAPTPSSASATPLLRGYINTYNEFKQWDNVLSDPYSINEYGDRIGGPRPRAFFRDEQIAYDQLAFLVDGIYTPYSPQDYSLDDNRSRVYVITYDNNGPVGRSYLSPSSPSRRVDTSGTPKKETILTFYVNPTHLTLVKKKLFQQIRTRAGWEFQHWGPQIGEIRLEGVTGNITPPQRITTGRFLGIPVPQIVEEPPTDTTSPALKAFRQLERWYDEDQDEKAQYEGRLLAVEYRGHMYVGHISEFSFEERADTPFMLYYNLTFLVHYESTSLTNATDRAQKRVIRNTETLEYINSLRNV